MRLTISIFMIYFYIKLSRDLFRLFAQFAILTSVDSIKIAITINRSCLLTVQRSMIEIYQKIGWVDAVTCDFIYT
jgi:hypothetical protein